MYVCNTVLYVTTLYNGTSMFKENMQNNIYPDMRPAMWDQVFHEYPN